MSYRILIGLLLQYGSTGRVPVAAVATVQILAQKAPRLRVPARTGCLQKLSTGCKLGNSYRGTGRVAATVGVLRTAQILAQKARATERTVGPYR